MAMRIESSRPYGLPLQPSETKESAPERLSKVPERAGNAAGDQFELSEEHKVTRNVVGSGGDIASGTALSAERLTELRAKVNSGYYSTPKSAEETARAVADFHR
ncbi:MAG: hypothetical protein IPG71_08645 [bacterium]|nr:hypothetical protein [bacterium]